MKKESLVGKRFGELIVIKEAGKAPNRETLYLCDCSCGKQITTKASHLKTQHTKSCGHTRYNAPPKDAPPKDAPPKDAPPKDAPPKDAPPKSKIIGVQGNKIDMGVQGVQNKIDYQAIVKEGFKKAKESPKPIIKELPKEDTITYIFKTDDWSNVKIFKKEVVGKSLLKDLHVNDVREEVIDMNRYRIDLAVFERNWKKTNHTWEQEKEL